MPDRRAERLTALGHVLDQEGLDALLVQHLANIRYLTGFSGSAGLLLARPGGLILITDFRYSSQAPQEAGAAARIETDPTSVWDRLKRVLDEAPPAALGYEAHVASVKDLERLRETSRSPLVPVEGLVERLRVVKAPEEVESIRAAAALAETALDDATPGVKVGETEFEVAARLEAALRRRGSEWHPFPTIVASGPRAALPHARTTGRPIGRGEWLLLDFGAQVDGYCADLTRTFVVGASADARQREVYDAVRAAQRRTLEGLRPGMTGRQGDALAREVLAARGFGEAFGHSLGHGLGLEVHEAPRMAPTAEGVLPEYAVVTIEPGVYFPGWGGVRLEEDVVLRAGGVECLSGGPTDLRVLG